MTIDEAVEEVLPLSTGRFRFVMIVEGMLFYSGVARKEVLVGKFDDMFYNQPNFSAVQYESKTEYSPGQLVWKTF